MQIFDFCYLNFINVHIFKFDAFLHYITSAEIDILLMSRDILF